MTWQEKKCLRTVDAVLGSERGAQGGAWKGRKGRHGKTQSEAQVGGKEVGGERGGVRGREAERKMAYVVGACF